MISALILAAGAGQRMGRPKALVELAGVPLVERVVRTCAESMIDEIVVVTGAGADEVDLLVETLRHTLGDAALRVVHNARWRGGRTGSIQAGWASCPSGAHALVFPVDHACVKVVTLDAMLGVFGYAASDLDVIVPAVEFEGRRRRGHPVQLSARLRDELAAMGPNDPLRDLVHRHVVLEVPVDDEGILLDLDTPEDLARAEAALQKAPRLM